jgi:5-carboxymethyl-2-hydroxymuconate isomerase
MPHIHLEYSNNLAAFQPQPILQGLNQALLATGHVKAAIDIKSRAVAQTDFVIGVGETSQAYVHVKVSLLSGRDLATKKEISDQLLLALQQLLPAQPDLTVQLCIEILEMEKACYGKTIIPAQTL